MKRVAFYTIDLCPGREYLMPWRTILEVANNMLYRGHETCIINKVHQKEYLYDYKIQGVTIYSTMDNLSDLHEFIKEKNIDSLFVQVTWRDGLKGRYSLNKLPCRKIAYFSGGVYDLKSSIVLWRYSSFNRAKPYLLESIVPKKLIINKLKKEGFSVIIGLTQYTTSKSLLAGFSNSITILPGKDSFEKLDSDKNIISAYNLTNKKYICYTGAPAPTRGSNLLLRAVDQLCHNDFHIVMLMRSDVGSDYTKFEQQIKKLKHPERVTIIKEKLSRSQLKSFFEEAYYAILPFIVIPSEVPLTYYEILSIGTPIISFNNGGTTKHLEDALCISAKSIKGLKQTLEKTWVNDKQREEKSIKARIIMSNHPSWQAVTDQWIKLIL